VQVNRSLRANDERQERGQNFKTGKGGTSERRKGRSHSSSWTLHLSVGRKIEEDRQRGSEGAKKLDGPGWPRKRAGGRKSGRREKRVRHEKKFLWENQGY